jgi:hypothetical protein
MRRVLGVGLALFLASCATQGPGLGLHPAVPAPPPPPKAASINGHGSYKTLTGGHGSCAGQSVGLFQETVTYRRRIVALYGSSERALLPVSDVQSRAAKLGPATENPLVASVQCGADGSFSFHDLQPGSYFIIARTRQGRASAPRQYVFMQRVVLNEGENRDVTLVP